jgi:hypothetical protein
VAAGKNLADTAYKAKSAWQDCIHHIDFINIYNFSGRITETHASMPCQSKIKHFAYIISNRQGVNFQFKLQAGTAFDSTKK